jgi:hypothetical protein
VYLEWSAASFWVPCVCYKYKGRLICWVGWQSTTCTNCGEPKRISNMRHIRARVSDSGRAPSAATRGTTAFSPNLWPFLQRQGDWKRTGQITDRSPTMFYWFLQPCRCHWKVSATPSDPQRQLSRNVIPTEVFFHLILQLHKHQLYKIHIAHEFHGSDNTQTRGILWVAAAHTRPEQYFTFPPAIKHAILAVPSAGTTASMAILL